MLRILPFCIALLPILLYALFEAGHAGKHSFTSQMVAVGLAAAACLLLNVLRVSVAPAWLLALLLVVAWRFPVGNALLFVVGWAAAWQLVRSPGWGGQVFRGVTWFCYTGVCVNLVLGSDWPLGNRNWLAMLVGVVWSVHVGRWLAGGGRPALVQLLGLSAVMLVLIFWEQRGQSALVFVAVALLAGMVRAGYPKCLYVAAVPVGLGLVCLFSGFGASFLESVKGASYLARLDIWRMSWAGFLDAPVFGRGHWGVPRAYAADDAIRYAVLAYTDREAVNAHNLPLQLLVTSGVVGILALVASVGFLCVGAIRGGNSRRSLPCLFGLFAFLVIGCVSKAPFTVTGLCLWGALFGALASLSANIGNRGPEAGKRRGAGGGRSAASLRWALAFLCLVFCVLQPVHHELLIRNPRRVPALPFWWVFPSDRALHLSAIDMSARFFVSGDHASLYRLEAMINAQVPRKQGWLRLGHAAHMAGRPQQEVRAAAIRQFLWNPFELREQENKVLRNLMLSGGREALLEDIERLDADEARALLAFARLKRASVAALRHLLEAERELSGMELAWLVQHALPGSGVDPDLRLSILRRYQRDLGRHRQLDGLRETPEKAANHRTDRGDRI